jgi:tryptophanyl-tRNA synthetase
MKKRMLTGDRVSGKLHLGHYVGSLKNRVAMQDDYECFIILADIQALTTNYERTEQIPKDVVEIVLDYLACGIDPGKTTVFVQSQVPELAELTTYFSMLTSVTRLYRNPTIKEEIKAFGLHGNLSYGFLGYPVSQASDILLFRPHLVPVGEDQVPIVELTREIARKFNSLYGELFPLPEAHVGECPRLLGIDGKRKMSKSFDNAIYISDSAEVVENKVNSMFTDPDRVYMSEPGQPEKCNVFTYYTLFSTMRVIEVSKKCTEARVGCVECKKSLAEEVNSLLDPIRLTREEKASDPDIVGLVLKAGVERARQIGGETLGLVKKAIHLDYGALIR